ncbi:MAG: translational machinery protein [Pseudomonadota bacterium]
MSNHFHALVWLDHREAKVFHFNDDESDLERVLSSHPHLHLHHKANSGDSGHAPVDKKYLKRVSEALAHAGAILITGPSSAKTELASFIKEHDANLAGRISGVETLDHPTDGALLALGRKFFHADDRMRTQIHS